MEEGRRREELLEEAVKAAEAAKAAKTEVWSLYRRIEGACKRAAREFTRGELEDVCEERGRVAAELLAARRNVVLAKRLGGEIRSLDGEIERLGEAIEAKEAEAYEALESESAARLTSEQVDLERELARRNEERRGCQEEMQNALRAVEAVERACEGLKEQFGPEYEGAMRRVVYQKPGPLDLELYRGVESGDLGVCEIEGRRYVVVARLVGAERTEKAERTERTEKAEKMGPSVFPLVPIADVGAVVCGDAGKTIANYERARKACESREFVERGLEGLCAAEAVGAERGAVGAAGAVGAVNRALRCMCDAYAEFGAKGETDGTRFVPMVEDPRGMRPVALGRPVYRTFLQPSVELLWGAYKLLCERHGATTEEALWCLGALAQHTERAAEEMSACTALYTMPSARVGVEGRAVDASGGGADEGDEGDGTAPPAAKRARVTGRSAVGSQR